MGNPDSIKIEKIAQLNLNEREWKVLFALSCFGVAMMNREPFQIIKTISVLKAFKVNHIEINELTTKLAKLGINAFDSKVTDHNGELIDKNAI